jgi:hypothetical protein
VSLAEVPPLSDELIEAAFDTAVAGIPFVSDTVAIAEFIYGVRTGLAKWGRPLSKGDLALLGLSAVLGAISLGLFKAVGALIAKFGDRARLARALAKALEAARPTREEMEALSSAANAIRRGERLGGEALSVAQQLVARVRPEYPPLELLLHLDGQNFVHYELAQFYEAYVKSQAGGAAKGPLAWARLVKSGRPRELLVNLAGPDYAKAVRVVDDRVLNPLMAPRPPTLTPERFRAITNELMGNPKLFDRVPELAEGRAKGPLAVGLAVLARHFKGVKGNAAEILSAEIQAQELARIAEANPGAALISGVMMRIYSPSKLVGGKWIRGKLMGPVWFSDNIIASRLPNGWLEVHAIFEVKSGYNGGLEATEQVFEWAEDKIRVGVQLVLPTGAKFLRPDGSVHVLNEALAFTYGGSEAVPRVEGLLNAERHIITARGVSHLGMDSAMQISHEAVRHELGKASSEEIDFVTAELLRQLVK